MNFFFYSRISTVDQNGSRQTENFKLNPQFDPARLFVDKISGSIPFLQRPAASKLFDQMTNSEGKVTIVVDAIDRLGRNLLDILQTIEIFTKNKINLKSLKEGFETLLENGKQNPTAQLVISVMGSIAQMERDRIKERSSEGIAVAKALGKYQGRKNGSIQTDEKLLQRHITIQKKLIKGLSIREIVEITGCSCATIIKVKKVMQKRNLLDV
jgi:DNA invertase Pin-like site-specific DNA recombinase